MSSDLEKRLAMTLAAHEGPAADPVPIVAGALTRGRRLRRKQRMVRMVGVAASCLMLVGAVIWLPISGGSDRAPLPVSALLLPAAPGEPGAASRPDLVGTTPAAVHFTVDRLLDGAEHATWTAGRGIESVELHGRIAARVMLARDRAALDKVQQTLASSGSPQQPVEVRVNGRPGDAWFDPAPPPGGQGLWVVRWRPVDGLWAQLDIYGESLEAAIGTASLVRFDEARRCVVPFRLKALPAGARVHGCSVNLGAYAEGSLMVGDETGRWLTVRAQRIPAGAGSAAGELRAGPHRVRRQGSDVLEMTVAPYEVEVFLRGWGDGYPERDGLTVLSGYTPAADVDDINTW
ncbi:hypothetical protein ACK8GE_20985 [Micromonosporaceae bacterium DT194]|uniref:hypothetical protein n=1 Tax=Melissospora conviva TaxID=3388432 RepID=UPI003C22A773